MINNLRLSFFWINSKALNIYLDNVIAKTSLSRPPSPHKLSISFYFKAIIKLIIWINVSLFIFSLFALKGVLSSQTFSFSIVSWLWDAYFYLNSVSVYSSKASCFSLFFCYFNFCFSLFSDYNLSIFINL